MDNVRPKALTRFESATVHGTVDSALDHLAGADRALRLEVADAARRWAARVDDEEFGVNPNQEPRATYTPSPCTQEYCSCSDCVARWERDRASAKRMERDRAEPHVELRSMDDFDDLKTDPVVSRVNELALRAPWEGTDG